MTLPLIPFLVMIVGILLWALTPQYPRVTDAGRWMFIVGLFWAVAVLARYQAFTLTTK